MNPKYRDAVRYGRGIGKNFKKEFSFHTLAVVDILFPRGFNSQAVLLCQKMRCRLNSIDHWRQIDSVDLASK